MPRKATRQTVTGVQGIAMIERAVGEMEHFWREAQGATDFGIDGDIELRDPGTGYVRNFRIGVQSRATTRRWAGETDDGFFYTPTQDEIDYWLGANQPVLLICSRPPTNEIYWRSMQEWARDPDRRATRRVYFDKRHDSFDVEARDQLFNLRASASDHVEPPTPARVPERVKSNLMPIRWAHKRLYSAEVPGGDPRTLFEPAHEQKIYDFSIVLRDGYVWSLTPIADDFVSAIGAGCVIEGPLEPWLDSTEPSDLNLVRDLVRRSVVDQNRRWITWHGPLRLMYFRRASTERKSVTYRWASRRGGRTVVVAQTSKEDGHFTGYRHDAATIATRRLSGSWFLQLRPTCLFTWDGHQVSGHHDSALAGIKRIETHPAVSQALRMWEHPAHGEADPRYLLAGSGVHPRSYGRDERSVQHRRQDVEAGHP
ncbi:MAG: DUF4365 domain-containing protein [Solirubrobacteraceae bacterium]